MPLRYHDREPLTAYCASPARQRRPWVFVGLVVTLVAAAFVAQASSRESLFEVSAGPGAVESTVDYVPAAEVRPAAAASSVAPNGPNAILNLFPAKTTTTVTTVPKAATTGSGPAITITSETFGFNGASTFVVADRLAFDDPARVERRRLLADVAADNAGTLRLVFPWNEMEQQQGVTTLWHRFDDYAEDAAVNGITLLPLITGTPSWAGKMSNTPFSAPKDPGVAGAFAAKVAKRYGAGGDYWPEFQATHAGIAPRPARLYEIWNEQNHKGTWCSNWLQGCRPNPGEYAALYSASRQAIKAVDPAAIVLVGGMIQSGGTDCATNTCAPVNFLAGMYRSANLRGRVDGVGMHPYPRSNPTASPIWMVKEMRRALAQAPMLDPNVPIYVTEIGWNTSYNMGEAVFTEQQRAAALDYVAEALLRSNCNVRLFLYHSYDFPTASGRSPSAPPGIRETTSEQQFAATARRLRTSQTRSTVC